MPLFKNKDLSNGKVYVYIMEKCMYNTVQGSLYLVLIR